MDENKRQIGEGPWFLKLLETEGKLDNIVIDNEGQRFFYITMVDGGGFLQPMIIERGTQEKIGDILAVFRQNPINKRWYVWVEKEKVFITETETIEVWRLKRSSIDNIEQSVKRTVTKVGQGNSNPRRIGGKPIFQHYIILGWSAQLAEEMMDVFDYINCPDLMGQSTFLKSLQYMPDTVARQIFKQMRTPPQD